MNLIDKFLNRMRNRHRLQPDTVLDYDDLPVPLWCWNGRREILEDLHLKTWWLGSTYEESRTGQLDTRFFGPDGREWFIETKGPEMIQLYPLTSEPTEEGKEIIARIKKILKEGQ